MENKKKSAIKQESNYIDKILKENSESLIPAIMRKVLGLKFDRTENLPKIRQQVTLEKEPDFLKIIYNEEYPDGLIVQLEFESGTPKKPEKRMLMYLAMIYWNTEMPIKQYCILMNEQDDAITTRLVFPDSTFAYEVFRVHELSYKQFIESTDPEEVVLTILTNRENLSVDEFTDLILSRLITLRGNSKETKRFVKQLIMLSRLRKLQPVIIKKIRLMTHLIDVENDILFLEGMEKGIEKGMEKGLEEGREEGEIKKSISGIKNMTEEKIDKVLIARFMEEEVSFVEKIQKQLPKEEKIIKELKKGILQPEAVAKKLKVHPLLVAVFVDELKKKK